MGYPQREWIEERRRNWRIAFLIIIAVTIPFYCAGFFLWGTAPRANAAPTATQPGGIFVSATPPGGATVNPTTPTVTSLPITFGPTIPLFPTVPGAATFPVFPTTEATFSFPTSIPLPTLLPTPTRFLSPTPPPPTTAPLPTNPPAPTNPPPPAATWTPLPFDPVN